MSIIKTIFGTVLYVAFCSRLTGHYRAYVIQCQLKLLHY